MDPAREQVQAPISNAPIHPDTATEDKPLQPQLGSSSRQQYSVEPEAQPSTVPQAPASSASDQRHSDSSNLLSPFDDIRQPPPPAVTAPFPRQGRRVFIPIERDDDNESGISNPLPALPEERGGVPIHDARRQFGQFGNGNGRSLPEHRYSTRSRVISLDEKPREKSLSERIDPTLEIAKLERDKYAAKAKMTGYALNIAIGLQVLLGSLTTGLSASGSGRSTSIATTILGALATLVASYLARARGSNEPELSITRVKDLEQFIRECSTFKMDYGHLIDHSQDQKLNDLRRRFEELLGNANGERKLATPV